MSRRISGAVFWGLVFVAFGTLFLARNLGYPVPLWTVVARYWPVLLIVWGVFKLADALRAEPGEKRSLFSGGDVAAIILVIVFGSLITLAADMNPDLGKIFNTQNFDVWDITGNNFTFTERHVLAVGANPAIEVEGNFGDVEITRSDSNEITLDVNKTIRASDQSEGERLSSSFVYSIADIGGNGQNKYKIASNSSRRYKAALTIRVPASSSVSVENRNGGVTIRGIDGNQEINNRFGDVEVQGIKGTVKIQNRNGTVHVEDIGDTVTISNSFGPINVSNVRGELKIDGRNNEIDIEHVDKDIEVESAFQNVDIDDPKGAVKVKSRNGEVSVRLLQPPTRDVSISSEFGDVNIEFPDGSTFTADVHTRHGEVHSDFSELQSNSHNADHSLNGRVGTGGPTIKVESRNGEIRFTKRG
jgi:hypothetical protein